MANPVITTNDDTLKLVEKFGFKFFGYDENNNMLVIAPNGQIVLLSIAYSFVQHQMAKASQVSGSGGPESIPQMPVLQQGISQPEKSIEKAAENKIESQQNQNAVAQASNNTVQVAHKSPQVDPVPKAVESPYGDSAKISFNPGDKEKVEDFVSKNAQKSKTSSAKWLSEQFKKFLEEQRLGA